MTQSTVQYNRKHTFITPPFYLSGHYFRAASSEEPDCQTYTGEKTKEATGFAHKGNTQVESVHDRYTYFIYLHAAFPWTGHVK